MISTADGMISDVEAALLSDLGAAAKLCIVEIGSYRGCSTIALASHAQVPVYAIDPHEPFTAERGHVFAGGADRAAFMANLLEAELAHQVRLVNLPSVQVAKSWQQRIDLLWIDGDHREEMATADVRAWMPFMEVGGVVALHDINEPGVQAAMRYLSRNWWVERLEDVLLTAQYRMIEDA